MVVSSVRRAFLSAVSAVTWPRRATESDEPIRSELFSADRLEQHAESLAAAQTVTEAGWAYYDLAGRARANGEVVLECYNAIASATRDKRAITPAAEWLVDNFHVIDEQLANIARECTPRFSRSLPVLTDGPLRGRPQVYGMVWSFVAHTDSRFDAELLRRFTEAYQRVRPLTIRELWAIPTILRCVLIENLRRLGVRIVNAQIGRREADILADDLQARATLEPLNLDDTLRTIADRPLPRGYVVQLVQRLRYQHTNLAPILVRLNKRLANEGMTWERLIQIEHASQTSANMTVRNLVTSMRSMTAFDWHSFFEEVSVVDDCLRGSPAFSGMDFLTRDRYRHSIEELARGSGRAELEVARLILAKSQQINPTEMPRAREERGRDPGYYLISNGRQAFEKEIGYRLSTRNRMLRAYVSHATAAYLGSVALLTAIVLSIPLWASFGAGLRWYEISILGVLAAIPASEIGLTLLHRWITQTLGPRHLPRLDLASGVPSSMRTFVVVPTMLTSENTITESVQRLEIHYLSNPSGDIRFALLSDWADADAESEPGDERLLELAADGIAKLNRNYGRMADGGPRFHLFHRKRLWSGTQNKWMGWERKRGKLHEFNLMLRGAEDTSFLAIDGEPPRPPPGVRYVVTLDADTRLPIGAVRQLVGTAAHPLNEPRLDPARGRVVEGYGVLQPRITPRLPSAHESSIFQRLFSAPSGVDQYAAAISDVYQDLFAEGSYTGKGLYDVDAFEAALVGRLPKEAVLSHDLLEGIFARCALVSDIELFEDFPSHSEVSAARAHRWTRGDWQLLSWMFGPVGAGMSAIGRWKLIDNLRRSLVAPAALATLIASWSIPLAPRVLWLMTIIVSLALPTLLGVVSGFMPPRTAVSLRHHFRMVADDALNALSYTAVAVALLANHAWLMIDAIARTLYRLFVSHKNMLEWVAAAHVQSITGLSLGSFLWPLRSASIVAIITSASVLYFNPAGFRFAVPFILLWWASPLVARAISLPPKAAATNPLGPTESTRMRLIARRTWRFFTKFVTAEDNWLPPDNFQEDPKPVVAHRSSPTNFGLSLLSTAAARDFGWLGLRDMTERLENTLKTFARMPQYRGHFYNWYDTRDLSPLEPRYISAVDSGNFAGHLLALEQACRELMRKPIFSRSDLDGVRDALLLLREAMAEAGDQRRTITVDRTQVQGAIEEVDRLLASDPASAWEWSNLWFELELASKTLLDIVQTFADERADELDSEIVAWAKAVHADIASHVNDLQLLPPFDPPAHPERAALTSSAAARAPAQSVDASTSLLSLYELSMLPSRDRSADSSGEPLTLAQAEAREQSARACVGVLDRLEGIAVESRRMFDEMDFRFLFDPKRKLFSVGYRVGESLLDDSFYDLLASEARLTSFIAIAKGEVPVAHWFKMGRPLAPEDEGAVLISWSGSMFEYLMPSLIMYTPSHSLLDQTCRLSVKHQIRYGNERGVPWGVSESAYYMRDRSLTYQYSAFGVPGLGFKRGLRQDMVVAPYATALAAMYDEKAAAANFARLQDAGGLGAYGFYEALDYTPSRLPENRDVAVVRAYFAHHQGMSLVALTNVLLDGIMRRRFHRHPMVQAADLLLQERTPREIVPTRIPPQESQPLRVVEMVPQASRRFHSTELQRPAAHLLSNGRYAVMVTAAGSGYSTWEELAVTRWREDATSDPWGSYIFLRDAASGEVWSAGYQPVGREPDTYDVTFSEERVRIHRLDGNLASTLEIMVSPEDDAEVRRLTITNGGMRARQLEITSYLEVVMAPLAADIAHPVFSNLFVQTEFIPEARALLAARRPRKASEDTLWAAHVIATPPGMDGTIEYETDRARFVGRGNVIRHPVSVMDGRPLSNTVGAVLDPIMSLRTRVRVQPGSTIHIAFATMVARSREEILSLADKYHDLASFQRIATLAWTHSQIQLHHLGVTPEEANLFQYLADGLLFADPSLRASSEVLKRGEGSAQTLWRHGISGDLPIVLLRIDDADDREIVRQLLRAHEYWRSKRLAADLVLLNEKGMSYAQDLQVFLEGTVRASQSSGNQDPGARRGGVFVLNAELMSPEERDLLQAAARVILVNKHGTLAEQVMRVRRLQSRAPRTVARPTPSRAIDQGSLATPSLVFFNGLGGFTADGNEYVTLLAPRQYTPLPWVNVIANPLFGCIVSESGSGYSWSLNSRENQITPWSNDPVTDWPGEVFYIRDDESGELWTPTALPIRVEKATYIARHGPGYSRFEHLSHRIYSELTHFVDYEEPVRYSVLTLENRASHERQLTVTHYVEWALGPVRAAGAPFIVTEINSATGALFARNPWNAEFGERVAFMDAMGRQSDWTGDRREFIGRNGNLERPAALLVDTPFSRRVGVGLDPCGVLSTTVTLAPNERCQIVFLLGQADNRSVARDLIERIRKADPRQALARVTDEWESILTKVEVRTPERSMDFLLNRWLLYQTLACRMWARAGFYQAGGAFGFRDQLQDSMALTVARPDLTRAHLLRSASRQFVEGDVQHWWHPPSGRGVRTHCSDDLLWLPYVTAHYISVTGDVKILDENVGFLEGPALPQDEEDSYFEPHNAPAGATLFDHCARAIERGLATGAHGLPLMGTGDWNDGMNRVGAGGKGESVWLGWFLYATLKEFSVLAAPRGRQNDGDRWMRHAAQIKNALEKEAWDGAWYRRAYFDDGTPLGTAAAAECRIDSIAQSWSAISGAGDRERAKRAMQSVEEFLVRPGDDLVLLFAPPFDKTPLDPGYIKGYLPGVRENGGQYTHAAVWSVIAFAALGEGQKANELFRMINPINRAGTRAGVHAYKVEPYVVAADIYSVAPHVRRGGWTWYTGAAGWLYRAGTEWILGVTKRGDTLRFDPCIPPEWPGYSVRYRHGSSLYEIAVENPHNVSRGVTRIDLDGQMQRIEERSIPLVDDGRAHRVRVVLG